MYSSLADPVSTKILPNKSRQVFTLNSGVEVPCLENPESATGTDIRWMWFDIYVVKWKTVADLKFKSDIKSMDEFDWFESQETNQSEMTCKSCDVTD